MPWWSQPTNPHWWSSLLAVFLISAASVALSILYAQRRSLIDQPGRRRSHRVATARGGGIGIVIAVLVALAMQRFWFPATSNWSWLGEVLAVIVVAAAGWIDDHRGLAARWRLLLHIASALLFVGSGMLFSWYALASSEPVLHEVSWPALGLIAGLVVFGLVWSINLHNFMDGINGLLACQAIFVFGAVAICRFNPSWPLSAWIATLFAAATAGFLPFNFPRARVFMGDVGSGALGLLIGMTIFGGGEAFILSGVIACSAFVTDATCTLLSRMLRGRRWYSAHREHLYQWLARSGFSHAGVVALYMGWNFVVVVPVLYLVQRSPPAMAPPTSALAFGMPWLLALMTYVLAICVWIFGKQWCLRSGKNTITRKNSE